jgi:hypothetical protein
MFTTQATDVIIKICCSLPLMLLQNKLGCLSLASFYQASLRFQVEAGNNY